MGTRGIGVTASAAPDRRTGDAVESPVAADDRAFAEYVASLVGAPVEPGDRYTVLRNGDEVFPPMLDAIQKARTRINFESFIYEDGEVGDHFTDALIAAARRGVTMRIVLDAMGGELSRESQKTADRCRHHGRLVQSAATVDDRGDQLPHPPQGARRRWRSRVHRRRGHGRSLARQRRKTRITGATRSSRSSGPAVRALEASFYENWLESGGGSVPALDPERPPQGTGAHDRGRLEQSHRRRQQRQAALPALDRRRPLARSTFSRRTSSSTNRRGGPSTQAGQRGVACAS